MEKNSKCVGRFYFDEGVFEEKDFRADKMAEECGVFGIYCEDNVDVSSNTYYALFAMQHRGQESAGMAVNNQGIITAYKDNGLVTEAFDPNILNVLKGQSAIGHVRYSTAGLSNRENAQPLVAKYKNGHIALAHNGTLLNAREIRNDLEDNGMLFQSDTDSEVLLNLFVKNRMNSKNIIESIQKSLKNVNGSYGLVVLTRNNLIAVRDPLGIRPLCLGMLDHSYVIASESCAFDAIGAKFVRDVEPGEIIVINHRGIESFWLDGIGESRLCVFEHVYFARPDSVIDGASVYKARFEAGRLLAKQSTVDADLVIGAPDSGLQAAMGYAAESGIPYAQGLLKNRYVGRTFIQPSQDSRELAVKLKFNPLKEVVGGKRVVMIDDSIVRGTTTKKIVQMLKRAGAKEVHMRISSPPLLHPCFYGVDISTRDQLVAVTNSVKEICRMVGADSLEYLTLENMVASPVGSKCTFCTACLSGEYPTELLERHKKRAFDSVE